MSLSSDASYRLQRARNSWAAAAAGWTEQRAAGSGLVSRVCAIRGSALERAARPWETDATAADDGYPGTLSEPCRRLAAAAAGLQQQLEKLQAVSDTLSALRRLEEAAAGRGDSAATSALPTAWDAARCAAAAHRLLPLYQKETHVKRTVAHRLAHSDSAAALTALKAAWSHDAYLTEEALTLHQCLAGEVVLGGGDGTPSGGGGKTPRGAVVGGTPLRGSPVVLASPVLRQRRT